MYGLHLADFIVIALYLLGVTAMGAWMSRRVHNVGDFAMPRTFGKVFMTFFAFGTGTNSDQAVTVAGKSFTSGISGIWYSWMNIFVTPVYWIIAPLFRRLRAVTTGDVFEARFGPRMSQFYALLGFTKLMFSIGVSLKGGAIMLTAISGGAISGDAAIFVLTILFVLYGTAGGLSAAIVTDFVQGLMTIVFSFILLPFVLHAIGGMDGLRAGTSNPEMLSLFSGAEIGVFFIIMLGITSILMAIGAPHTMGNCAAGRNEMDGAVGYVVGSFLKRICTIAWALVGLAGTVYFAGQIIDPEETYGRIARDFLPPLGYGVLGFFLATLMAGLMSTCDSLMVAASALFTQNLYRPLIRGRNERHYLWVVRITSVVIVAGAVVVAYQLPGFIRGMEIYWKLGSVIGIPLLIGLIWRGITPAGAWASVLVAYGAWMLTTVPGFVRAVAAIPGIDQLKIIVGDSSPAIHMPWQILFYLTCGILAGIIVSRYTRQIDKPKLDLFYALMRTPIQPGEVVPAACSMPIGAAAPLPNYMFPGTGFELLVPSRRTIVGFLITLAGVFTLIGFVLWLV